MGEGIYQLGFFGIIVQHTERLDEADSARDLKELVNELLKEAGAAPGLD